jgi:hypothetical protein
MIYARAAAMAAAARAKPVEATRDEAPLVVPDVEELPDAVVEPDPEPLDDEDADPDVDVDVLLPPAAIAAAWNAENVFAPVVAALMLMTMPCSQ